MGWTYNGNLGGSDRDLVRFLLGDVTQTAFSPQDSEIDYWIGVNLDPITGKADDYKAASEIATAMANRYATRTSTDIKIGGMALKYDYPAMAAQYRALAAKLLEGRTAIAQGGPVFDTSLPSYFGMGMMDHP